MQESMTAELPVWVFGRCRWVSGVCRRTTCQDVLEAVLATPADHGLRDGGDGGDAGEAGVHIDPSAYVIVERWKGVERRLDGRVRLLKVWAAWGEAQSEVQLLVRRVCEKGRSSASAGPRRHGHGHGHRKRSAKRPRPSPTMHDQGEVHRLMKLILAQGETIAGQLRRLREREAQIERLEAEAHREREAQHGKDYVLAAYLGHREDAAEEDAARDAAKDALKDTPKTSRTQLGRPGRPGRCGVRPRKLVSEAPDDAVDLADESDSERDAQAVQQAVPQDAPKALLAATELPARHKDKQLEGPHEPQQALQAVPEDEDGDIGARIALWEKVVKVNKRLEQQEERLVRLYVGFRRSDPEGVAVDDRDQLRTSLARLEQDIADGRRSLEANADLLSETDALLDAKRRLLRRLLAEMEAADMDTARLMAARDAVRDAADAEDDASCSPAPTVAAQALPGPPQATAVPAVPAVTTSMSGRMPASCSGQLSQQLSHLQSTVHSKGQDNDSNSDTGLSSLHSSSEEGVYILDTLV